MANNTFLFSRHNSSEKAQAQCPTTIDSYIADIGNLKVLIMNIFTAVDGKGSTFNEGELQRWLAESVWFPTNLLPSEMIKRTAMNENTVKLSFHYKEISFDYIVIFNEAGGIVAMKQNSS